MQYTEKDLKEGTKLRCTHSKPAHWTVGKVYEVSSDNIGELSITDNDGSPAFKNYMLDCLNGNHNPVSFEIVDEEKEMKKYAKITKYFGRFNTDKRNGLEIGKEYEIVRFNGVSEDCWIYLNDKTPEYYISRNQYKLVEKEGPVALIEVDTLKLIEAKIEQLRDEQENLHNKRMRIKHQEEALRDKRMKLVESKKAFEFLKQQKFL
ncbi:tail tape measure protein [Enterococcus phage vB_Efa_VP14]|nr:tail tape measure protein [Enterococcus phage vB_Efa_VP14]